VLAPRPLSRVFPQPDSVLLEPLTSPTQTSSADLARLLRWPQAAQAGTSEPKPVCVVVHD
jgi:hypothetical protein